MSNPWPEKWLDSCVENYHLDPEKGLEGTRWFRYLWEAADCALKEAEELTAVSYTHLYPAVSTCSHTRVDFSVAEEETRLTRKYPQYPFVPSVKEERDERCEEILNIQAMGLKKRMEHIHSRSAVVGLSGGLDSTLALLVMARAFDPVSYTHLDVYKRQVWRRAMIFSQVSL